MKKIFIDLAKDFDSDDNPSYVNIFNIDYIVRTKSDGKTTIAFKGSANRVYTSLTTKEIHRRINIALNGMPEVEEIDRFQLVDMEE